MTDETADTSSDELDEVRHLLRAARLEEPIPPDVGARLDRVLADLSRERPGAAGEAPGEAPGEAMVIALDPRRRRRAAGLLVAAAAIVVGGVTAAQQLSHDSGGSASTAAGNTDQAAGGSSRYASTPPLSPSATNAPEAQVKTPPQTREGGVLVRPGHFSVDVLAARGATTGNSLRSLHLKAVPRGCVPAVGDAVVVPATYEKAPAALVFHTAQGSTQVVDLYICGTARPVRSVTLPMP